MAFNGVNPVSVGNATKKVDWDRLWDNVMHVLDSSTGNIKMGNVGPHAIGGTPDAFNQLVLKGSFTPASGPGVRGFSLESSLTPLANGSAYGALINPTFNEASSGTHAQFASLYVTWTAVNGAAAALTEFATLYVAHGNVAGATWNFGMVIDSGGDDGIHLAFRNADVAHGMTSVVPTDIYGCIFKVAANDGGLTLRGLTEQTVGLILEGVNSVANTDKTGAARAIVEVQATTKSGTTVTVPGADANVFGVRLPGWGTVWFIDKEGDTYRDGTDNTFFADAQGNEYDDALLALAWEHAMNPQPGVDAAQTAKGRYTKQALIEAKLLGPLDPATGRHFQNESALLRVALGGLWKEALRHRDNEDLLAALAARVTAAEAKLPA